MNQYGVNFRLAIWGESHGPQVGITMDGVPAGIPLAEADFEADLARRRKLLAEIEGIQTILTCTHTEKVLFGKAVNKIRIVGGKIKR